MKIKATVYMCDASDCDVRRISDDRELPYGFHGTVQEIGEWGGSAQVKWYACTGGHVGSAIANVLARDDQERQGL